MSRLEGDDDLHILVVSDKLGYRIRCGGKDWDNLSSASEQITAEILIAMGVL